ncbi:uncharacterized protein LOC126996144 isoform X6 [Eriocheir sinensis]|uniref:uncharacterized protein LOC126996144 isoform X6 n=1 Tax=Eriocheir sinensis TaxID=95602 RepID=UPI0021C74D56|nr:uncharacterized protein LOC126996144 isoform X6 [Eriocheir sinensis]
MEIYRAIADFSEDLVLAYLRERSEAVGIPCKFSVFEDGGDDGRGSSSDEDRVLGREGEHEARTWRERDGTEDEAVVSVCVRVKDRARSIDSGVCVETKRENGRGRKTTTENGGREWMGGNEAEACGGGGYGGARVSCRAEGGGQEVCKYDSEAPGYCEESSGHLLETHPARDSASSLVLAFRRGDLFGAVEQEEAGQWWGVLALRSGRLGYVPSSYLKSSREVHLKALGELQTAAARLPHPEVVYGAMIPEPDYSDDERDAAGTKQAALVSRNNQVNASSPAPKEGGANTGRLDEKGLIMPKKLVNPNMESTEKKSLHRELLYNQKRGVSVLNQKTELQKAMEKHNDKKVLKEIQKEKEASLTPFQKALDERAQKLEQMEKAENKDPENEKATCEFQKIHAKVRAKMEVQ